MHGQTHIKQHDTLLGVVVRKGSKKMFKNMSKPQKDALFASSVPGTFEEFVLTLASGDPLLKYRQQRKTLEMAPTSCRTLYI
jgi:hypothetical protein